MIVSKLLNTLPRSKTLSFLPAMVSSYLPSSLEFLSYLNSIDLFWVAVVERDEAAKKAVVKVVVRVEVAMCIIALLFSVAK